MTIPPAPILTQSVEDYLKVIYRLSQDGEPATTNAIAQALDLAPPSVSGMVRRLAEQGLLEHERYRGVALTEAGRRAALRMIRRHRILESYLVARLGYTWDTVHDEAEQLEHAVSDELIGRMADALGHPTTDPHGDPIPDADGRMAEEALVRLDAVPAGTLVQIRRVDICTAERLRYLGGLGLTPGARAVVLGREPFQGPVRLAIGDERHSLGGDLAALVFCAPQDAT